MTAQREATPCLCTYLSCYICTPTLLQDILRHPPANFEGAFCRQQRTGRRRAQKRRAIHHHIHLSTYLRKYLVEIFPKRHQPFFWLLFSLCAFAFPYVRFFFLSRKLSRKFISQGGWVEGGGGRGFIMLFAVHLVRYFCRTKIIFAEYYCCAKSACLSRAAPAMRGDDARNYTTTCSCIHIYICTSIRRSAQKNHHHDDRSIRSSFSCVVCSRIYIHGLYDMVNRSTSIVIYRNY